METQIMTAILIIFFASITGALVHIFGKLNAALDVIEAYEGNGEEIGEGIRQIGGALAILLERSEELMASPTPESNMLAPLIEAFVKNISGEVSTLATSNSRDSTGRYTHAETPQQIEVKTEKSKTDAEGATGS
jgi:hypothetical protein